MYHRKNLLNSEKLFNYQPYEQLQFEINDSKLLLQKLEDANQCNIPILDFFKSNPQITKKILSAPLILIKPNITSAEIPEMGRTTNPVVLKAVIECLKYLGVSLSKVLVGDSSVIGVDTMMAAKTTGILDLCETFKINFKDFNNGPFIDKVVKNPLWQKNIPVYKLITEEKVFKINIGKIKTTYGSPVGLCIKNLKGIIRSEMKLNFHIYGVQESLVDLRSVATCNLNILEGFPASELGHPKEYNLIGISNDDILLDIVISELMGIPFNLVMHLKLLAADYNTQILKLLSSTEIINLKKELPTLHYSIHGVKDLGSEFGINIVDGNPCSSCLESFYKSIDKLNKKALLPQDYKYILGLFHNNKDEITKRNKSIFIGTCALSKINSIEQRKNQDKITSARREIPGCPPTIDSMVRKLQQFAKNDSKKNFFIDTGSLSGADISLKSYIRPSKLLKEWFHIPPFQNVSTSRVINEVIQIIPKEKVDFTDLGKKTAIQCELITAAICHQINWDFLRLRIKEAVIKNPNIWDFDRIKNINSEEVDKLLFDYPNKERIRAIERAKMLRQLSNLKIKNNESFLESINMLSPYLEGSNGLLALLRRVEVFAEDPEMKKAFVLVHSLYKAKLWKCNDEINIRPAIDYHIMRLYIRRGNISAKTKEGEDYLTIITKRFSSTTSAFRSIVAEAMRIISDNINNSIVTVNGAEWWIGRSVCNKGLPDCDLKKEENFWLRENFSECPYKNMCAAWCINPSLMNLQEPKDLGKFY